MESCQGLGSGLGLGLRLRLGSWSGLGLGGAALGGRRQDPTIDIRAERRIDPNPNHYAWADHIYKALIYYDQTKPPVPHRTRRIDSSASANDTTEPYPTPRLIPNPNPNPKNVLSLTLTLTLALIRTLTLAAGPRPL